MKEDIEKFYYSEEDLRKIVKRLGAEITRDYQGKNLLLVSILKGSVVFMADLMREIDLPCSIDFMCVSSYGNCTASDNNEVNIRKDLDTDIRGVDVLIVEDILDTGRTLNKVIKKLWEREPASIKICALLDKPERRVVDLKADYWGTEVPNAFVVGYGLDYAEKYRNLPYVGVLKEEIYKN